MKDNLNKVVIIGCGNVGMSYAYALVNSKTYVNKLYLIDLDKKRVEGEVMDLNHALPYTDNKISINIGSYKDCKDANIVMISAGVNQAPGETRLELLNRNARIFKSIVDKVMASGFKGIFLIATNPVDIMSMLTLKYSKIPPEKVIGTGTSLDTARLQLMIGKKLCINPKNIGGYVIGEHGDSEFIPWSILNIASQNIKEFLTKDEMIELENDVRNAAYEIIERKGATYYGIGTSLVKITNAILGNENTIMSVSTYDKKNKVYFGKPVILNKDGAKKAIHLNLTKEEENRLQNSIDILKENIKNIK